MEFTTRIIKEFISSYKPLYELMKETEHGDFDKGKFSSYHVGESVWTHTMMVLSHMENIVQTEGSNLPQDFKKLLLLAALFHDTGKVYCKEEKEGKITFYNHANISSLLIKQDFVRKVLEDSCILEFSIFMWYLTLLVNQHQLFFKLPTTEKGYARLCRKLDYPLLVDLLLLLRKADSLGNINSQGYIDIDFCFESKYATLSKRAQGKIAYVLVGLPGAGKTTWANKQSLHVVSRDDEVMKLGGNASYMENWGVVDQKEVDANFEKHLSNTMTTGESFILDETNLTRKSRKALYNRLKEAGYFVQIVLFLADVEHCVKAQNTRPGKSIDVGVITNMAKSFSMPLTDEYDDLQVILPE